MRAWHGIIFWILMAGCCTTPSRDAVALYQAKHSQESKSFAYIYPVGTKMYDTVFRIKSTTISGIGHPIKEKFGASADVSEYADKVLKQEAKARDDWDKHLLELRNLGTVCEFERVQQSVRSRGLLVLNNGEIVKEDVWTTMPSDEQEWF